VKPSVVVDDCTRESVQAEKRSGRVVSDKLPTSGHFVLYQSVMDGNVYQPFIRKNPYAS
jgi:hypothetical protein